VIASVIGLSDSVLVRPDRSVDSSVDEWRTADGRTLISDYGFYNGPFSPGPRRLDLIECQTGGNGEPQIVTFRTGEGFGAGLYWVVPGGRTIETMQRVSPLSLWVGAESPRAEHLPELLAIVRSVRLHQ
jgi:hypothetical protein